MEERLFCETSDLRFFWKDGYRTPNYKVYKYEHSRGLVVLFEVQVRLVNDTFLRIVTMTCWK